jgi:hypothetical protein
MKLYYTTRELSDHASEIWLLRALGAEVLDAGSADTNHAYRNVGGGSGGASWLQEHLRSNYSVCWSTPSDNIAKDGMLDAGVCDSQANDLHQRWSNYCKYSPVHTHTLHSSSCCCYVFFAVALFDNITIDLNCTASSC